jgi:hypothetical protein
MFEDAKHLRAQALLCLETARQMSSKADANDMKRRALEYILRADRLEEGRPEDGV